MDEYNVLFLRIEPELWVRFFFDAGVFFWSIEAQPDLPLSQEGHDFRLIELIAPRTVIGCHVESVEFTGSSGDTEVSLLLHFSNGISLVLHNNNDQTSLLCQSSSTHT